MLSGALDDWDEQRWEEPLVALEADEQSPFFVGRKLSPLLNESHRSKIEAFFDAMSDEAKLAALARNGGLVGAAPVEMARARLAAFRNGLESLAG